ncbi:hypothetical protein GOBAR_AA03252 [Gossypium barbadense]|uniref:Uncharacterized protein n=1 Tax=Gossypium barbadense TaxID=3634 RepID=A0A2P5YP00_GOSBA|nr:hypothetical protein GOBAR_AA03252 [Gossypium barbadense]
MRKTCAAIDFLGLRRGLNMEPLVLRWALSIEFGGDVGRVPGNWVGNLLLHANSRPIVAYTDLGRQLLVVIVTGPLPLNFLGDIFSYHSSPHSLIVTSRCRSFYRVRPQWGLMVGDQFRILSCLCVERWTSALTDLLTVTSGGLSFITICAVHDHLRNTGRKVSSI